MTDEKKPEKPAFERLQRWKQRVIELIVQHCYTSTAACRAVRPKSKRPDLMSNRLRKEPLFLEALEQERAKAVADAGINPGAILLRYHQFANGDARACTWQAHEALPEGVTVGQRKKLHELDEVTARCVEVTVEGKDGVISYRWPSRVQAGRLLGQALKMLTDTHEINLGEKTLEQLVEASWNRPRPGSAPDDDTPPAAGL